MKKYLQLFVTFFKASLISDLEYRMNMVVKIGTDIIWYAAQLSVFEVIFRHTNSISGWDLHSTRVFMAMLFIVDGFYMLIFSENLDKFSDKVRRGDLDMLLAKPVNAQFMMSFQKMMTAYVGNILLAIGWLVWSLIQRPAPIDLPRLLLLFIAVPSALSIMYGIRLMFSAAALIFTRAENINYVWHQLYRLGTRPDAIYPPWLRYTVLSFIPVGFIASVPARLILEPSSLHLVFASVGVSLTVIYLSTRFWKLALKSYSSASS